jgi:copper(I)-binding protein
VTKVLLTAKTRRLAWLTLIFMASPCVALDGKAPSVKEVSEKQSVSPKGTESRLQVRDAWVRLPPPGSQMVAVYMTIANQGSSVVQLSRIEVDGAMSSDLHETSIDQAGISSMRTVTSLDIPPGESRSLAPGGLHVMVMGLNRHLREGDRLNMSLTFKNQAPVNVTAVVKP